MAAGHLLVQLVQTTNKSIYGGTVVSAKMNDLLSCVTRPESLVSLHLHPYRTICMNCVRIFNLHGMDYHSPMPRWHEAILRDTTSVCVAQ